MTLIPTYILVQTKDGKYDDKDKAKDFEATLINNFPDKDSFQHISFKLTCTNENIDLNNYDVTYFSFSILQRNYRDQWADEFSFLPDKKKNLVFEGHSCKEATISYKRADNCMIFFVLAKSYHPLTEGSYQDVAITNVSFTLKENTKRGSK